MSGHWADEYHAQQSENRRHILTGKQNDKGQYNTEIKEKDDTPSVDVNINITVEKDDVKQT